LIFVATSTLNRLMHSNLSATELEWPYGAMHGDVDM